LITNGKGTPERARMMIIQEHPTLVWQTPRREEGIANLTRREIEEVTSDEHIAMRGAQSIEGKSLVLLQVNCRSILNKSGFLEFN
jgi:hypothetical protein